MFECIIGGATKENDSVFSHKKLNFHNHNTVFLFGVFCNKHVRINYPFCAYTIKK